MKKRGQITLFIIVGMIILSSVAVMVFFRNLETGDLDTTSPIIEDIKSEFLPIKLYVDQCLSKSLKDGIKLLGDQGGYIYLDGNYAYNDPTESDGVVWNLDGVKTAYWQHNPLNNKEQYDDKLIIPSLKFMQNELENYVLKETIKCIDNFNEFKKIGYDISEDDKYEINIKISPNSVDVFLNHKIKLTKERTTGDINYFFTSHNVNLKQMHELASYLSTYQAQNKYLEEFFLNIYSMYEGKSATLPPRRDVGASLIPNKFWIKDILKKDIDNLLFTHMPLLQIRNSRNEFFLEDDGGKYFDVKSSILDYWAIGVNESGIDLNDIYKYQIKHNFLPNWNTYFDVNDDNGIIKPKSTCADFAVASICVNRYDFIMDYSFPVVVSVEDSDSFNGEGFTFNFALEGNIRNNLPVFDEVDFIPKNMAFLSSMLCEPESMDKEISIKVLDRYNKNPLSDARVYYGTESNSCQLGITDSSGVLKAKVPDIIGGILSAEKDNYVTENIYLDTYFMKKGEFAEIELWELKELSIEVNVNYLYNCKKKHNIYWCYQEEPFINPINVINENALQGSKIAASTAWTIARTNNNLAFGEKVLLSMDRHLYDELPSGKIPSVVTVSELDDATIKLIPGKYDIDSKIISYIDILIEEEEREIEKNFIKTKFTIPETSLKSEMFMGGYEGIVNIWPDNLYSSDKIILNVVKFGFDYIPDEDLVVEDLNILNSISEISRDNGFLGIQFISE